MITLTVDYGAVSQAVILEYTAGIPPEIIDLVSPAEPVPGDTPVEVPVTFQDDVEEHTVTFDWGDAMTSTLDLGSGDFDATDEHLYVAPGVYTVTVTVTDATGLEDAASTFVVVFDPLGQKILGRGEFASSAQPSGDDDDDERAEFAFSIKVNRNDALKGDFGFEDENADLEMESETITGLFVFDDWAYGIGTGELDDGSDVEWQLTVIDGKRSEVRQPDYIRIRIWAAGDPDDVMYDNQPGEPALALPTTEIVRGNIEMRVIPANVQ